MIPDKTVINRVIYYSIISRDIKITLLQLRKTMIMIRGLGLTVPSYKDLKDVELELMYRANEIENSCRILLSPLFENIDFGHKYLNHWSFSMNDIKEGFCRLEEIVQYKNGKPHIFGRKYILLLHDYIDESLGKFYAGELVSYEKAVHFIDNIPPQKDKVKGLYDAIRTSIDIAVRYRTSKPLSNE